VRVEVSRPAEPEETACGASCVLVSRGNWEIRPLAKVGGQPPAKAEDRVTGENRRSSSVGPEDAGVGASRRPDRRSSWKIAQPVKAGGAIGGGAEGDGLRRKP